MSNFTTIIMGCKAVPCKYSKINVFYSIESEVQIFLVSVTLLIDITASFYYRMILKIFEPILLKLENH